MRKVINGPTMEVFRTMRLSSDIGTVILGPNLANLSQVMYREDSDKTIPGFVRVDIICKEIRYVSMGGYIMELYAVPTIGYIHIFDDEIDFFSGEKDYHPLIFSFTLKKGEIVFVELEEKDDNPQNGIAINYMSVNAVEELRNRNLITNLKGDNELCY